ncbi:MAG: YbhB/YbcL family Raf kinase inhibitor-like protein [Ferruginibacter sp.]
MREITDHPEASMAIDYIPLKLSSSAFSYEGMIPAKYTCDGENISPPLDIDNIPEEAKCLVLIVDDPDAPVATWVHWLVWNIPLTHHLKENDVHGIEGLNDFQQNRYGGPCPPSGTHRYFFKVYALRDLLNLPIHSTKLQLEKAMGGHIIGFGEWIGLYERKK